APGMNLWAGQAKGVSVQLDSGALLPLPLGVRVPDGPVTLGIRPQHLRPEVGGPIRAEVRLIEALGPESVVHADMGAGGGLLAVLPGQPDLGRGAVIELGYEPQFVHVFGSDGQRLA
ncbi:TOBE domain-containing protein, partial [Pseudotabrizicola sp.]